MGQFKVTKGPDFQKIPKTRHYKPMLLQALFYGIYRMKEPPKQTTRKQSSAHYQR